MVQLSTLLVLAVSSLAVTSKPVAIDGNTSAAKLSIGTNAERIANGMSPFPPTKRSTGISHHSSLKISTDVQLPRSSDLLYPMTRPPLPGTRLALPPVSILTK
jgi:hypothetical protein